MQFSRALALCVWLCAACSAGDDKSVGVPPPSDAGEQDATTPSAPTETDGCVEVTRTGDTVVEQLEDFTATFQVQTTYDRTVMLFGGEPVQKPNTPSRAYIYGLDKADAQMMAKKYPDFYLCSSPGGQEAATYIKVYDLVPATCEVYQQLLAAIRVFTANAQRGGDRTSLRLEGATLDVTSVLANASGEDVKAQVEGQQFHLVTKVQQLTGESVLAFGTTD
jgi:hypothetical protein